MSHFYIYQDDTSPGLTYTLSPVTDLNGASATFTMKDRDGTTIIDAAAATIADAVAGIVRYAFQAADTDVEGEFTGRFTITYGDSSVETFPNASDINISIRGGGVYAISVASVLDGFSTGASTADVAGFISLVDQADACLTANTVSGAVGKQLKTLAVRHLLANSNDRGSVTMERSTSGAARSYKERRNGDTGFLETLRSVDQHGCVMALLSKGSYVQFRSIGRRTTQ